MFEPAIVQWGTHQCIRQAVKSHEKGQSLPTANLSQRLDSRKTGLDP
jgi:hypothetical protein